ncbi:uncharacterized protein LOC130906149 [Corythoichthys intestinalis]|uniref:uncharacterized protein LOC130906149 n=1 Tax=Corythoichthys intestinalis TaxID=161448 RepID=UPI0025A5576F|nr:uncharacterized protein LOC130906149 [Corythoichthys intestinalis]
MIKLQGLLASMVKQRAELDEKRRDVDAGSERVNHETEKLLSRKNQIDADEERLATEKEKMEQLRSEMKAWEENSKTNIQSVEILKANLLDLKEKILGSISKESVKLEAHEIDTQKTRLTLKSKLADFEETADKIHNKNKLLQREMIKLQGLLASMVKHTAELDEKRRDVDAGTERVNHETEKLLSRRNQIDADEERLATEKEKMEQLRSEMKAWEENSKTNIQSVEILKANLQSVEILKAKLWDLNEKILGSISKESVKLEAHKIGIEKTTLSLKTMLTDVEETADKIHNKNKLLQGEIIKLQGLLSNIVKQRAELDEKRRDFDSCSESVNNGTEILLSMINHIDGAHSIYPESGYAPIVSLRDKVGKEKRQRLLTQPESLAFRGVYIVNISEKVWLRKIWKDTNMEKKGINQMKCTGREMKKHLEKRLKVVTGFVQTYWLDKAKTFVEKKHSNEEFFQTWQSNSEEKDKTKKKNCLNHQKLKAEILCAIEALAFIKEKTTRALNTCELSQNNQLDK